MRPIRFGVIADAVTTREDLVTLARQAEDLGYSTLLIRDHVIAHPFGPQLAPIASLAMAAAVTTRLRIGTMVISNDFRPPVQLAKEFATLDLLSGGRVELGLGAGFLRAEYGPLGLPFEPPGVRVGRLEESLQLLKRLFAGGEVTHRGWHYTVDRFDGFPPSMQRPHPPLLVAGSGDRMLGLAAREANIVGIQTVTTSSGDVVSDPDNMLAETVDRKVELIRQAAGERFDALELNTTIELELTGDREAAALRIAERGWDGITVGDVLDMPGALIGTEAEIVEQLRARRNRYGLSYFVVGERDLETAAPFVASFANDAMSPRA